MTQTSNQYEMLPDESVATTYLFAEDDNTIYSGEINSVYLAFQNESPSKRFNVTRIYAALMHPQDPTVHLQNFTHLFYNRIVDPGPRTSTFQYFFYPDQMLENREYPFVAVVHYHDGAIYHENTFINTTVSVTERPIKVDTNTVASYGFGIVAFVVVTYTAYNACFAEKGNKSKKKNQKASSSVAQPDVPEGQEFIAHLINQQGGGRGKKNRGKKKN
eukprot:CAMPEP_0201551582 /NCGR_PEP_ID=MMETSP0173_2-20130828/7730_1 /ASSEMBLY_ACC=CAM_ASM_000268 /TAXON_ID=218659 /ORGANISM="Vexillifera sp., Strain DIVA3 564/2" /LENGTH=216 /DNA_ID=CAMNT_0047961873 /DNA_START=79 /DNA_END=729 /DNA_ORIENTATION=+